MDYTSKNAEQKSRMGASTAMSNSNDEIQTDVLNSNLMPKTRKDTGVEAPLAVLNRSTPQNSSCVLPLKPLIEETKRINGSKSTNTSKGGMTDISNVVHQADQTKPNRLDGRTPKPEGQNMALTYAIHDNTSNLDTDTNICLFCQELDKYVIYHVIFIFFYILFSLEEYYWMIDYKNNMIESQIGHLHHFFLSFLIICGFFSLINGFEKLKCNYKVVILVLYISMIFSYLYFTVSLLMLKRTRFEDGIMEFNS